MRKLLLTKSSDTYTLRFRTVSPTYLYQCKEAVQKVKGQPLLLYIIIVGQITYTVFKYLFIVFQYLIIIYQECIYICIVIKLITNTKTNTIMNTFKLTNKINILSILAVLAYALLIISSIIDGKEDFTLGFNAARYDKESKSLVGHEIHFVSLKSKSGVAHFPETIEGKLSDIKYPAKLTTIKVIRPTEPEVDKQIIAYNIAGVLLIILYIIIIVLLPIHFFMLIGALKRNEIFSSNNIRMVRFLGFELLSIYAISFCINYLEFKTNSILFNFTDYEIARAQTNALFLVLGIAILVIGEIIKKGEEIKTDTDLTI